MIHDPSTPGGSDRPKEPENGEAVEPTSASEIDPTRVRPVPRTPGRTVRSAGSWGAELERKIMSALTLAHWDVEQHPDADRVKVDFIVRRNIRKLQMPRPILIQVTTWLDNSKKWLDFLETARQHFGDNNSFLYIECEITENRGRKRLCFDELPVMTAVGNIVSFFDKASDHNIFRLRMAQSGNSFRRVSNPEQELERERRSRSASRTDALPRYTRNVEPTAAPYSARRSDTRLEGRLTAWKSVPGEDYKDYGWIEAPDGSRYNAYWKAFADLSAVENIRDLSSRDPGGGPWVDLDIPVRFRVLPPQVGGKHPRAVDIELLNQ